MAMDHEWTEWTVVASGRRLDRPWAVCKYCGVVRREDGQNKPCRGMPLVLPREDGWPKPSESQ